MGIAITSADCGRKLYMIYRIVSYSMTLNSP